MHWGYILLFLRSRTVILIDATSNLLDGCPDLRSKGYRMMCPIVILSSCPHGDKNSKQSHESVHKWKQGFFKREGVNALWSVSVSNSTRRDMHHNGPESGLWGESLGGDQRRTQKQGPEAQKQNGCSHMLTVTFMGQRVASYLNTQIGGVWVALVHESLILVLPCGANLPHDHNATSTLQMYVLGKVAGLDWLLRCVLTMQDWQKLWEQYFRDYSYLIFLPHSSISKPQAIS